MTTQTLSSPRGPSVAPSPFDVARSFLLKDWSELWIVWAALVLLAGTAQATRLDLSVPIDLLAMILVGRWILLDPPAAPRAFWRSLPVGAGTLLASKTVALLALVLVPLLALQSVVAARIGLGLEEGAKILLQTGIYGSTLVVGAAALAARCRDFPQFVLRGVASLVLAGLAAAATMQILVHAGGSSTSGDAGFGRWGSRPPGFEAAMFLGALPCFGLALALSASLRRRRVGLTLLVAGLAVLFVGRTLVWAMTSPDETAGVRASDPEADPSPRIELVNVKPLGPQPTRLHGWPRGVAAGIRCEEDRDTMNVVLTGMDGTLHLANGTRVPVSRSLERNRSVIRVGLPDRSGQVEVVELFSLAPDEIAKLRDVPGRLELDVRYQVIRHAVMPFHEGFRLVGVGRRGSRVHVETEQLSIAATSRRPIASYDLLLWSPDRSTGFRLSQSSGSSTDRRIGVLTHPEMRVVAQDLDFELEQAVRLPEGDRIDASAVVTDEWLARARVEAWALRWEPERERRITIPDFRIGDWWIEGR